MDTLYKLEYSKVIKKFAASLQRNLDFSLIILFELFFQQANKQAYKNQPQKLYIHHHFIKFTIDI
jgi:hypothetical protein